MSNPSPLDPPMLGDFELSSLLVPSRDVFALEKGLGRDVLQNSRDRQGKLGLTGEMCFRLTITQWGSSVLTQAGNARLVVL